MSSELTHVPASGVFPSGKYALIAGLHWQWVGAKGRRRMRIEARDQMSVYWLSLPAGTPDDPASWLGYLSSDAPDLPKGKRPASLVASLAGRVPEDCWGVFLLPDGQWWFMAFSGGHPSPYGDVVGDASAVMRASGLFLASVPAPSTGWVVFDPDSLFSQPDHRRETLHSLLPAVVPSRARMHKTESRTSQYLVVAAVVLAAAAWGGNYWLKLKEKKEHEAWVQAQLILAREASSKKADSLARPWGGQPYFADMLTTCVAQWRKSPISIAGSRIHYQTCDVSGKLTPHYQLKDGVTVSNFAARSAELYGPGIQARFNMPGASDDAWFELPIHFVSRPPEELLPGDEQLRRMTSYAQRLRAQLHVTEPTVLTKTVGQEQVPLPWKRYGFTFITDIPIDRLFDASRFQGNGLRLSSVKTERNGDRITYTLEGMLYAEN